MIDRDPTSADELIAAYLDGEATADERDLIHNDPELRARAEFLAQIVTLVGEPVGGPDAATRNAQIRVALEASNTDPKVTSLTARRARGPEIMRIASVAAVVAAIMLAVPLLFLLREGDDDRSAGGDGSGVIAASDVDGSTNGGDDGAASNPSRSAAGAEAPADEARPESLADVASDDEAAADDGSATDSGSAAETAEADSARLDAPAVFLGTRRVDIGAVSSTDQLAEELQRDLDAQIDSGSSTAPLTDLGCLDALADSVAVPLALGTAEVDGIGVEYVFDSRTGGLELHVFEAASCDRFIR